MLRRMGYGLGPRRGGTHHRAVTGRGRLPEAWKAVETVMEVGYWKEHRLGSVGYRWSRWPVLGTQRSARKAPSCGRARRRPSAPELQTSLPEADNHGAACHRRQALSVATARGLAGQGRPQTEEDNQDAEDDRIAHRRRCRREAQHERRNDEPDAQENIDPAEANRAWRSQPDGSQDQDDDADDQHIPHRSRHAGVAQNPSRNDEPDARKHIERAGRSAGVVRTPWKVVHEMVSLFRVESPRYRYRSV